MTDLSLIKEGQSVKISARGLSETTTGKIVFVSPLVDKDTRTARVVAEIQNADQVRMGERSVYARFRTEHAH